MPETYSLQSRLRELMEAAALGIEVLAVTVIVIAVVVGTLKYLVHLQARNADAYATYKRHLVKALLLGLEFLVAADIVRTVALDATLGSVAILGALVVVRTFLSWSLVVEEDGHWPWQSARVVASSGAASRAKDE